jgi:hypothetical protein
MTTRKTRTHIAAATPIRNLALRAPRLLRESGIPRKRRRKLNGRGIVVFSRVTEETRKN